MRRANSYVAISGADVEALSQFCGPSNTVSFLSFGSDRSLCRLKLSMHSSYSNNLHFGTLNCHCWFLTDLSLPPIVLTTVTSDLTLNRNRNILWRFSTVIS